VEQVLVTVVVPVYKAEKYLDACVRSILGQSYPVLEILLIDDGSPDGCPALCDGYAREDERISVIHQTNRGAGFSRNAGLDAAHGKYVFFMDADDCLDGKDAIRHLLEQAEKENADITMGCYRKFNDREVRQVNSHHLQNGEDTGTVDFRFRGFYQYGHLAYNWGKLYRRDFLTENALRCKPYPIAEDKVYNMECYVCGPKYAFLGESVYLYRINQESVTSRYQEGLIPAWISIATDFHEFLIERRIDRDYRDWSALHIFFGSFFLVKQELQSGKRGIRRGIRAIKEYGGDPFVRESMVILARGRYLRDINSLSWRVLIRAAAWLLHIRAYWLFVLGISLVRMLKVDGRITNSRNRRK